MRGERPLVLAALRGGRGDAAAAAAAAVTKVSEGGRTRRRRRESPSRAETTAYFSRALATGVGPRSREHARAARAATGAGDAIDLGASRWGAGNETRTRGGDGGEEAR